MNTTPPAVAIGPPRLGSPINGLGSDFSFGSRFLISPSGASHFILPLRKSTATTLPHGGGEHGIPLSAVTILRRITYGVPCIRVYSSPSRDALLLACAVSC